MLELCRDFFSHLNESGVRYCHWKSNEHLDRALEGKTDLDVLVDADDAEAFAQALAAFDFKEVLSPVEKRFPGMADYLGFDQRTGALVHLHRHFKLVLGQKYIKNHHLPIEKRLLSDLHLQQGVAVPSIEMELLLLIIRAHLKVDWVSLCKHAIKDLTPTVYTAFPSDIESELHKLMQGYEPQRLRELLQSTGLPIPIEFIEKFIRLYSANKLKAKDILFGQRAILSNLKSYQRDSGIAVHLRYFRFYLAELPGVRLLRVYKKKVLPAQGKVFSIVGADGSGKSTLSAELNRWLSWKLWVNSYYYGIPKNKISRLNYYLNRLCERLNTKKIQSFTNGLYWLYVAKTRLNISFSARAAANAGKIVITDRFPLIEFTRMEEPMDGPRLAGTKIYQQNGFAEKEQRIYQRIEEPDYMFVLQVSLEQLRQRKTDLDEITHRAKAEAVNAVAPRPPIVLIDANRPYQEVLLDIKRRIWAAL